MEELQDAIEDAQYMNAMHDGIPRPTKGWKWPTQGITVTSNAFRIYQLELSDLQETSNIEVFILQSVIHTDTYFKSQKHVSFFLNALRGALRIS